MAITIRLPWAAAIRAGVKLTENRSRPIAAKYIGQRVAIHAGSVWDSPATLDRRVLGLWWTDRSVMPDWRIFGPLLSHVLAVATIAGRHPAEVGAGGEVCCAATWGNAFHRSGVPAHHIVLADVRALVEPVGPVRGQLHVPWALPEDVAARVLAAEAVSR